MCSNNNKKVFGSFQYSSSSIRFFKLLQKLFRDIISRNIRLKKLKQNFREKREEGLHGEGFSELL